MARHIVQRVQYLACIVVGLLQPILHSCPLFCIRDLIDMQSKRCDQLFARGVLAVVAYSAPKLAEDWIEGHRSHVRFDDVVQLLHNNGLVHRVFRITLSEVHDGNPPLWQVLLQQRRIHSGLCNVGSHTLGLSLFLLCLKQSWVDKHSVALCFLASGPEVGVSNLVLLTRDASDVRTALVPH